MVVPAYSLATSNRKKRAGSVAGADSCCKSSSAMPSAMLEHEAQRLGLRDSELPIREIASPQHMQMDGCM